MKFAEIFANAQAQGNAAVINVLNDITKVCAANGATEGDEHRAVFAVVGMLETAEAALEEAEAYFINIRENGESAFVQAAKNYAVTAWNEAVYDLQAIGITGYRLEREGDALVVVSELAESPLTPEARTLIADHVGISDPAARAAYIRGGLDEPITAADQAAQ